MSIVHPLPVTTVNTAPFQPPSVSTMRFPSLLLGLGLAVLGALVSGCATNGNTIIGSDLPPYELSTILPGDVISISFPGATNLNTVAKIPVDGTVRLPFGKPISASGKTRPELEQALLAEFEAQLLVKEVNVGLVESAAMIYVSGAVVAPGKVPMDRPLTLMDALMNVGGPDMRRAKLETVSVVRNFMGEQRTFIVDMRGAFAGGEVSPFYLRPFDSIVVPARKFNF